MKERILISALHEHISEEVTIAGWVDTMRNHGKVAFLDIRDRSGVLQTVVVKSNSEAWAQMETLRPESTLHVRGTVNTRPEKMIHAGQENGDIELEIISLDVLSLAEELPFEKDTEVNLDTLFDYRPLTLRSSRARDTLAVSATIEEAYGAALSRRGFTRFQAPALVGGDAEGGAEVFKVEYINNVQAYLATSPQLYKQIMVGVFERVFTIAKIFRAEKSATTRHLSEITQMDFEMGFIESHRDVCAVLEEVVRDTVAVVAEKHADIFTRFNTTAPLVPEGSRFPMFTLTEAQNILESEYGIHALGELDMEPEHERKICEWAREKHNSDFVFITAFPTKKRAFYTYEEASEAPFSRGFDLLFRGLEINSGAQRIHDYTKLTERIVERGMDPEKFQFYLQAFKYGMPPHGGCSTGLERFTARMLELPNVKEAVPFPRDMNRIDTRLSE